VATSCTVLVKDMHAPAGAHTGSAEHRSGVLSPHPVLPTPSPHLHIRLRKKGTASCCAMSTLVGGCGSMTRRYTASPAAVQHSMGGRPHRWAAGVRMQAASRAFRVMRSCRYACSTSTRPPHVRLIPTQPQTPWLQEQRQARQAGSQQPAELAFCGCHERDGPAEGRLLHQPQGAHGHTAGCKEGQCRGQASRRTWVKAGRERKHSDESGWACAGLLGCGSGSSRTYP